MGIFETISQILGQKAVCGMAEKARVDPEDNASSGSLMSRPKFRASAHCNAAGVSPRGYEMRGDDKYNDTQGWCDNSFRKRHAGWEHRRDRLCK